MAMPLGSAVATTAIRSAAGAARTPARTPCASASRYRAHRPDVRPRGRQNDAQSQQPVGLRLRASRTARAVPGTRNRVQRRAAASRAGPRRDRRAGLRHRDRRAGRPHRASNDSRVAVSGRARLRHASPAARKSGLHRAANRRVRGRRVATVTANKGSDRRLQRRLNDLHSVTERTAELPARGM